MTDKEIIKALEYLPDRILTETERMAIENALDLINRQQAEIENCYKFIEQLKEARNLWEDKSKEQQAEIERLQGLLEQWKEEANRYQTLWCEDVQIARAEAIKEFAEKLADVFYSHDKGDTYVREVVYNLVKEMVGEDK